MLLCGQDFGVGKRLHTIMNFGLPHSILDLEPSLIQGLPHCESFSTFASVEIRFKDNLLKPGLLSLYSRDNLILNIIGDGKNTIFEFS